MSKKKAGRIPKDINWQVVELYIKSGSSQKKIADSLGIHPDTLRDAAKKKYGEEYSIFSTKLQSEGELLIEAQQFQKAMKGYWPALLWLGKVRLGQKEPEQTTTLPPQQNNIDKDHRIMELENQLNELKEKNADITKTE